MRVVGSGNENASGKEEGRGTGIDSGSHKGVLTSASDPGSAFRRLHDIVRILRAPSGCPWDREQTLRSLREALIEEAYECVDAITNDDAPNVREELGDSFLLATMMSEIASESNLFSLPDVLNEVSEKLIRRHPHVFADSEVETSDEVIEQWNDIKTTEKTNEESGDFFAKLPGSFPPLRRAAEYQKKAAKHGFDWPDVDGVFEKIDEEIAEIRTEIAATPTSAEASDEKRGLEDEIGDLLFAVVNLSRFLGVDPDVALASTNAKFRRRFTHVVRRMTELGKPMSKDELAEMEDHWNEAKDLEKTAESQL